MLMCTRNDAHSLAAMAPYFHIDLAVLHDLIGDDTAAKIHLVRIAQRFTVDQMSQLEAALGDGDRVVTSGVAHSLRGTLLTLGAHVAVDLVADIEQRAADFDLPLHGPVFERLCVEMQQVQRDMTRYLETAVTV